jgi:hypothetical protein
VIERPVAATVGSRPGSALSARQRFGAEGLAATFQDGDRRLSGIVSGSKASIRALGHPFVACQSADGHEGGGHGGDEPDWMSPRQRAVLSAAQAATVFMLSATHG